ncbi:nucleoside phosphorylase domain-containing protein [Xylariomycetidae sp. FL0641]|nr:nucleoside phosphorylase domain-containing protein [Xylariomycetidae sp. FL0641]
MAGVLPETFDRPVHIAVIGGTGLYKIDGYTPIARVNPQTPWGRPSAPILILEHAGTPVAFLARHGAHHELAPHELPARANVAALRSLGVRCVVAFSAVGSLQEEIRPMDFVVPDQVIDRTKGVRPFTFFDGGLVGHVPFGDPYDARLRDLVKACAKDLAGDLVLHSDDRRSMTAICMEGPQFSTRAESRLYQSWGGDVISMSLLPEAKLAREAEMAFQVICMATDYDCWKTDGPGDVDVSMVMHHMHTNGANARRLVAAVLDRLCTQQEHADLVRAKHWEGQSKGAVAFCTKPEGRSPDALEKARYLFGPDFLADE